MSKNDLSGQFARKTHLMGIITTMVMPLNQAVLQASADKRHIAGCAGGLCILHG